MTKDRQVPSGGPGGGERSEPEPGPPDGTRRRAGPRPGRARTRAAYTPQERRSYLEAFRTSGLTQAAFCRASGVAVETLRHWLAAFESRGEAGLDQPHWTGRRRGRPSMAKPLAAAIVETKRSYPDFGLRKVRDYLARFVGLRVSAGGVRAVLEREGVEKTTAAPRRGRGRPAIRRFERAKPGELWQSDFTSYVLARESRRVFLIVFLDDHSRYIVSWGLFVRQTSAAAMETLLDGVARYGKPREVLTDQGRQYFAWRGKSAFQKLLVREGIVHVVSRSHHPETLGKCERLWETIGRELWDRAHPQDLADARERLGHYVHHYNHFRPHQGIGGMVPADRFFGAESEVRRAMEASMDANELRLALGERPRKSVYLVGRVGDEVVSLHGERGRIVVSTRDGVTDVDLNELGVQKEADHGADDDSDDDRGGRLDLGGLPAQAPAAADGGPLPASGVPDQRDLGGGVGGGAEEGADALRGDPGILARAREQGGPGAASGDAAGEGVAALAACDDGHGGGLAEAADGEARSDAETGPGGEGAQEAGGRPRVGDGAAAAPDPAAADDAGQRGPGASEGGGQCSTTAQATAEGGTRRSAGWSWSLCGLTPADTVNSGDSPGRSA